MFDASGKALDSLNVFKYCYTGSEGNANTLVSYETPEAALKISDNMEESDIWNAIWWGHVNCTYKDGTSGWTSVNRWFNSDCEAVIEAYKNNIPGVYTIHGIMKDSENSVVKMTVTINGNQSSIKSCSLAKTAYTYTGKAISPAVTVTNLAGQKLVKDTDYTVTYAKGRTKPGTYKVTVKGKGVYSFTMTRSFSINPKAVSITKLTAAKKSITLTRSKAASGTMTKWQVVYAQNSKFTGKTVKTKNYAASSGKCTITGLKRHTTYYVKVRSFKRVSGKNYYSAYSKTKKIKTK